MSDAIFFQQVTVVPGDGSVPRVADILWSEGKWHFPETAPTSGVRIIPSHGKVLLPGLFDFDAHLREPGREDAETLASGAAAAIAGGFTGLLLMPDTTPPVDNPGMVRSVLDMAARQSPIPMAAAGCLSKGRAGQELAEIGGMAREGARIFTDDPDPIASPVLLRRALQYARDLGALVATFGDVRELSSGGTMHDGTVSCSLGLPGMHPCAEEIGLARDLRLAQSCGGRLHLLHVTTAEGVATLRRYKQAGLAVTAGVTPHHLVLTDAAVGDYNTACKVRPPLRPAADADALLEALADGTIDVIATDHSPHTEFEKQRDFASAPFGATGLETALPVLHDRLVRPGRLDWSTLVARFSTAPRRILGLPIPVIAEGSEANAVLFDPTRQGVVHPASFLSKGRHSPFAGQSLEGGVTAVLLGRRLLLDRI
jgi:dihydroorotase